MDEKDMQAKIDEAKKASDDKLAAAQKTIKDLKSKLAKMKADSEDDDDDDDNNEDNDDDSNDDENENQNSQKNKKGKKGTKGAKAKFEDPRIKGLEQELAIPIIEKMVKAREMQGMPKEQIEEFTKAVSAKSLEEVKSQYNSEKFFIESISAKQEQPDKVHFEFNGNNGAPLTAKSIEEVLGEVSA